MEGAVISNQTGTSTSDNVRVISMLYDGAIKFITIAKKKMETGDSTGKSIYIEKTSAIVKEMSNSLNMDGGELAQNLKDLYAFVLNCLSKAKTQNDLQAIDDAARVLDILKNAWKEMQDAAER